MKMQLRLSGNYGKFIGNAEYIKVDEDEVVVEIVTNFGYNTTLYAKLNNGIEEKSIRIKDRKFAINNDYLNVGECLLKIVAMVGSKKVGEYTCTPILIKELDNNKMIIDKINEQDLKIKEFLKEYKEDKEYIQYELKRMQKSLRELIIAE